MVSNLKSATRNRIPSSLNNGLDYVTKSKQKGHSISGTYEQIRDRSAVNLVHKSKRKNLISMAMMMAMVMSFYVNMSAFQIVINNYVDQTVDHTIPREISEGTTNNADGTRSQIPPKANLRGLSTMSDFSRKEVMRILKLMNNGKYMNKQYFKHLLRKSKELLRSYETVYDITFPKGNGEPDESSDPMVTVVGDIHGQFFTMLHIFQTNGFPSTNHVYIFNGDFVDRGQRSIETLTTLLLFKLHCPECIHFTRGNHETETFLRGKPKTECISKYDEDAYDMMIELINEIPLGVILDQKLLAMHAGITSPDLTIDELKAIPRGIDASENALMEDLLWADPMMEDGLVTTDVRGIEFGPDVSKQFLDRNHLNRIIRGHTTVDDGYKNHHNGKVVTIWSAPQEGIGSYANIDSNHNLSLEHFPAFPKTFKIEDWGAL